MNIVQEFPLFLLVLVRMTSFFLVAPLFSYKTIPSRFKLSFAIIFSFIITLTLTSQKVEWGSQYPLLLVKEAIVGLSIGFVAGILFYAIQLAGTFIDLQMGFAMANLINPENGSSTPLSGQFLYIIMMVFLFTTNAHYMILNGIYYSFQLVPIDVVGIHLDQGSTAHFVTELTAKMFAIALQMALPIVGCLFLVDVAVGIIARTVPQLNVFVVGVPLKIGIGLIILLVVMPLLVAMFREVFELSADAMKEFMTYLGSS
ncbi:flagellar biosynthetic protein FliR [Pullulanibacillus pueri]|uniref:Flagellar biosynthetic protein FliR n=1 Tax=Pullulanibacillus pueri TaxID=1437324 RepID=A0A8J3ELS0_9BACL|nr:flagellar biosynthetic protein FliR [Pullulanibacillus pueri]MBM7682492.1 flagellar biosynthetic protein FliR [Pullulanibacillus pueri]GGH82182.1 flagellar biosynthetic protein FliR [Pullulanibacillus pueri]